MKNYLDEIDMNIVFSEIYSTFDNIHIEYAGLGGEGCEFSLRMVQK